MLNLFFTFLFLISFSSSIYAQNVAWIHKSPSTNGISKIINLIFLDENYLWILGEFDDLLKTKDGVENWFFLGK